jgi:hypothetical protein
MIFKKRNITSIKELTMCLVVCRLMKVVYLSLLLCATLYCAYNLIPAMSQNLALITWCGAFLSLITVNTLSHIAYLKDISSANLDSELRDFYLNASILELYKADACNTIENYSNSTRN